MAESCGFEGTRVLTGNGLPEAGAAGRHPERPRRPRIDRSRVLAVLERLLAERWREPLYVSDLCAATALPERTLRHVVVEQYGTSPVRLLRSRRLNRLRETLRRPEAGQEKLATIAGRHGFWHQGQLATDYRRLFGELPSETLRRCRVSSP